MTAINKEEFATAWHQGERLRVKLKWQTDRYVTELYLDQQTTADEATPQPVNEFHSELVLRSQEGTAADRWPASPPLQDLAIESRGNHTVALAVGMAGKAHWSASVETLAAPLAMRFDYACRLTEEPEFLGTTLALSPDESLASRLVIEEVEGGEASRTSSQLQITSAKPLAANSVWTTRWKFILRLKA